MGSKQNKSKNNNDNHLSGLNNEIQPQSQSKINRAHRISEDYIESNPNENYDINLIKQTIKKEKKIFVKPPTDNLLRQVTQQKSNSEFRKFKFNGITVVQDLKDYFPKDIKKDEITDLILNAFGDGIVDDIKYYVPGKTVTIEQTKKIVDFVFDYIKDDIKIEDMDNANILPGVTLIIDLVDLDKDIIRNKMFKGQEPSQMQLENTLRNLSGGLNYVKILSIEFNE